MKLLTYLSCLAIVSGSLGMIAFSTRFSLASAMWMHEYEKTRLLGLNGFQVWVTYWGLIIAGTVDQAVASLFA